LNERQQVRKGNPDNEVVLLLEGKLITSPASHYV
jgi:hypothetical protein